ncbi:cytochrome c biogenesis CcdA family protein [Jatrophihabitans endophyticus]|uniref:cytochrome c biogenesis CcdA family protein n=1 Tax=Jatrophihabitans endophyticus TaxID=1206085 RepID=UPI0019D8022E|nr:cytochrome c biogenesis protein CcdA [Jatrophihabitans endophyticus]MBE7187692.1 cytochrome c biogenesis protein CcdA [Jatrophihabitans endophyticus]
MTLADAGFSSTVQTGPLLVAAGVSLLVGVVGFLSPCVLPLVPGYLSYVAGITGDADRPSQRRMLGGALLFVLGFTALLVAEGALFGQLGRSIELHTLLIERILGAVTIVMGVVFLGGLSLLQRDLKIHRLPRMGLVGAPVLGFTFALAWTPCLTPTFSAIFGLSVSQQSAGRGALLMAFYCLGLGIPFVLVALGFGWVSGALGFVRRHRRAVSAVGGVLLIAIGVLLLSGEWNSLMIQLRAQVGTQQGFEV